MVNIQINKKNAIEIWGCIVSNSQYFISIIQPDKTSSILISPNDKVYICSGNLKGIEIKEFSTEDR